MFIDVLRRSPDLKLAQKGFAIQFFYQFLLFILQTGAELWLALAKTGEP